MPNFYVHEGKFCGYSFMGNVWQKYVKQNNLAWEIQLSDWSTAGNLSNWSSGVQIPGDGCTHFGCYLYSTKCSWIIIMFMTVYDARKHKWFYIKHLILSQFLLISHPRLHATASLIRGNFYRAINSLYLYA